MLRRDQINFITKKVMKLGSQEEVAKFYSKSDRVCKFANRLAKKKLPARKITRRKNEQG